VLRSLRELQATLVRVDRLAALQRIYVGVVPRDLARKSRVTFERSGTLVVVADTSTIAHKLRQLAPRVIEEIVKSSPEVTSIHIDVQVTRESDSHPPARPMIGPNGLASLCELRDALRQSPLREALDRMIQCGVRSNGQDQALQGQKSRNNQGQNE
jgi:hypothetical protein